MVERLFFSLALIRPSWTLQEGDEEEEEEVVDGYERLNAGY